MKRRSGLGFLLLLLLSVALNAQNSAENIDPQISKSKALSIVNESAWAKTYQSTSERSKAEAKYISREMKETATGGSNEQRLPRDFGPPPVTIRLFSSKTLRRAIVRLQKIDAGYDRMSSEQKARFDADRESFLECAVCTDLYIVTITKSSFSNGDFTDEGVLQSMTFADLKGSVRLAGENGEARELVQFTPPNGGSDAALLFFRRYDENGNKLITPRSRNFRIEFEPSFLDSRNRYAALLPRSIEFRVKDLVVNGQVDF